MIDDEPPIDTVVARQVADVLSRSSARARAIVHDHVEQFDEVLSTVLLDEVGEWFRTSVHQQAEDAGDATRAINALAELYGTGDDAIRTVIATGLIEAMPDPHDEDRAVVDSLPVRLREELRTMESWRPDTHSPDSSGGATRS